jgi:hypothetical protein
VDTTRGHPAPARTAALTFTGKRSLHLVQFAGPVKPEWYRSLEKTGVQVVDYIPHNAYLVYGDAAALRRWHLAATQPAVQFMAPSECRQNPSPPPAHRPASASADAASAEGWYQIQLVADESANADTLAVLDALKLAPFVRQNAPRST